MFFFSFFLFIIITVISFLGRVLGAGRAGSVCRGDSLQGVLIRRGMLLAMGSMCPSGMARQWVSGSHLHGGQHGRQDLTQRPAQLGHTG